MPDPSDYDSKDEFVDACIAEKMDEGDEQDQAVAACNSIWEDHVNANREHDCSCDGQCRCSTGPSAHALPRMRVQVEQIRTESLDGRSFRVAPVIPAVGDNVMNEALVPAEEWARSLPSWNGRPLPVNHPEHNGMPISANDPAVLERSNVGFLFNARLDDEGKFKAELWIDEDKAQRIAPDVLNALDEGRLEVSTAYFADDEIVNGEADGKPYRVIHRNLRPDHVALLPNTLGACSWEDGCGAPRLNNAGADMDTNARTPSFDGTTRGEWNRPSFNDFASAVGAADAGDVADLSAEQRTRIANMTLLGNADADDFDGLVVLPVVDPATSKLNANALDAVLAGRGSQAEINAHALDSAREVARGLLEQHFDRDISENKGLLKRAMDFVFRRNRWDEPSTHGHGGMDTRQLEHALMEKLEDELSQPVFVETVYIDDNLVVYEALGDVDEPAQLLRRGYSIDDNGDIALEGDVQEVQRVVRYEPVSDDSGEDNPAAQSSPEDNSMDERIKELISNENAPFGEDDQERLEAFEEATLDSLIKAYRDDDGGDQHQHDNSAGGGADDDSGDLNTQQGETVEQFIERAPAGLRDQLRTMQRQHEDHREQLVKAVVDNERNVFSKDELRAMDTEQLEKLANFAKQPSYEGRGSANRDGGPQTAADRAYTQDEVPRLNRGRQAQQQ